MDFKKQTMMFLEAYKRENEIIEEGIGNNSASNRLKSLIDKAEKNKSNKDVSKVLETLKKGYNDFLKVENNYKNASASEKKQLKKEYDNLRKEYSYQLKRIHLPKGAAAALLGSALAITGAGYGASKYAEAQDAKRFEKVAYEANAGYRARKAAEDAMREVVKKDYISKIQKNKIEKMKEDNKAFEAESENVKKVMDKAEMELMTSHAPNDYDCVKARINGDVSKFDKVEFKKFAKTLFSTYGVKVNAGDDVLPAIEYYLSEYNKGSQHNLYNKEMTRKILQNRIISKEEQKNNDRRRETSEKLKAHPTSAMEYFKY